MPWTFASVSHSAFDLWMICSMSYNCSPISHFSQSARPIDQQLRVYLCPSCNGPSCNQSSMPLITAVQREGVQSRTPNAPHLFLKASNRSSTQRSSTQDRTPQLIRQTPCVAQCLEAPGGWSCTSSPHSPINQQQTNRPLSRIRRQRAPSLRLAPAPPLPGLLLVLQIRTR